MPPVWEADVHLTREEAARMVERQFPELAPARLEHLGTGWDNAAYTVNGRWVFRFPRRKMAVALLENEARLLSRLAPHLPLRAAPAGCTGTCTRDTCSWTRTTR